MDAKSTKKRARSQSNTAVQARTTLEPTHMIRIPLGFPVEVLHDFDEFCFYLLRALYEWGGMHVRDTAEEHSSNGFKWDKAEANKVDAVKQKFDASKCGPILSSTQRDAKNEFSTVFSIFSQFFNSAMIKQIVNQTNANATKARDVADFDGKAASAAASKSSSSPPSKVDSSAKELHKSALEDADDDESQFGSSDDDVDDKDYDEKEATGPASASPWDPISVAEFLVYVAIWFIMCLFPQPRLRDHWKKSNRKEVFGTEFIRNRMGRNRWMDIHRFLSVDIPSLTKQLFANVHRLWVPFPKTCVDEHLSPFKGRYKFRVRIPTKPKSTGIRLDALADEKFMFCNGLFYRGEKRTTEELVQALVEGVLDTNKVNYTVYMDSYWGGKPVAEYLLNACINFVMACASTRPSDWFKNWLNIDLKLHEPAFAVQKFSDGWQILACSWKDNKKTINFLSTIHGTATMSKTRSGGTKTIARFPKVVDDYNHGSRIMDKSDAYISAHEFPHRIAKWTTAVFGTLLWIAFNNAIVFHQQLFGRHLVRIEELVTLCEALATAGGGGEQTSPSPSAIAALPSVHAPIKLGTEAPCQHCRNQGKVSTTDYACNSCESAYGNPLRLHLQCFDAYSHQSKNRI
jgi:hypothetical protein